MTEQLSLQRESWGPRFWRILHTLAETSGQQVPLILKNDEADAWILLLKLQEFVMPCALCKEHYKSWRTTHRVDHLRNLQGDVRKEFLRRWLWDCHNRVNASNQKPEIPIEEAPTLYPKASIQKEVEELATMFKLAITKQVLKYEDTKMWRNVIQRLRILVGV